MSDKLNRCIGFVLLIEYPNCRKRVGYFEPMTTGEFRAYPKIWKPVYNDNSSITKDEVSVYTEDEVSELLDTQRGNCYVAILSKTISEELASVAGNAPEPSGGKWRK